MHYIYCITNKLNNKSYVGQTENLEDRWSNHKRDGEKLYKGRVYAFQNALHKYGNDSFTWQVIETHDNIDDANEAEEFFIDYLGTLVPNGYNIKRGGNNHKLSEETKNKISEKLKITGSFVGKKGQLHPNFGKKLTQEHKNKITDILSRLKS
jgi:group I intron endonuclease